MTNCNVVYSNIEGGINLEVFPVSVLVYRTNRCLEKPSQLNSSRMSAYCGRNTAIQPHTQEQTLICVARVVVFQQVRNHPNLDHNAS